MKQKICLSIEDEIIRGAKRRATEQGRSLTALIQDVLVQYLRKGAPTLTERMMAYQFFCERPMKVPPEQLRHILEEDPWDP
jgi:Family of unknown function (DUF6364)